MVLIGLGDPGTNIINSFSGDYNRISITTIDFPDKCITDEDYEKYCPKFKKQLSFEEEECWFVLCGASITASSSLRILENLKNKKVNLIYVCPDPDLTGPTRLKRHKVVFNVLQEYTRSGLLNSMCIVSNKQVLNIIGNQSIAHMYDRINKTIANTIETIMWFKNQDPIMGSLHTPKVISRIYTVSIGNMKNNDENMLFFLDNTTETCYIYSVSQKELESNKQLIPLIRNKVLADEKNNISSSFAIYPSEHKQSYLYSLKYTHFIQPMETN